MLRQWFTPRLGIVGLVPLLAALVLVFAAPAGSAPEGNGCAATNATAVDFVYSGNYKKTGLYEFAWVTNPVIGAAAESFFGVNERKAYFLEVESISRADRNADQIVCVFWLGENRALDDHILAAVDNLA